MSIKGGSTILIIGECLYDFLFTIYIVLRNSVLILRIQDKNQNNFMFSKDYALPATDLKKFIVSGSKFLIDCIRYT